MHPFTVAAKSQNTLLPDTLRSFTFLCGLIVLLLWASPLFLSPLLHPIPPPVTALSLPQEAGQEAQAEAEAEPEIDAKLEAEPGTEPVLVPEAGRPNEAILPAAIHALTVHVDERAPIETDLAAVSVHTSAPAPYSSSPDVAQASTAAANAAAGPPSHAGPLQENGLTEKPFPRVRIPVLNYHSITVDPGNPATITPDKFFRQMTYLKENGYTPLRLEQFTELLEGKQPLRGKPVLLTFDDGYADNYEHALPVLKELGFHATLFVSPGTVEDGYFLNWDQIKEMHQAGWDIQPHGMTHPHLPLLNGKEQTYQIAEARRQIEEQLGTAADIFCYPYGEWNTATLKALQEHRFRYAFTIEQGWTTPEQEALKLTRIFVNGEESLEQWISKLEE